MIYLDNAATSQKPRAVIDAITRYYEQENANIHRGVHFLSELATSKHDRARQARVHAATVKVNSARSTLAVIASFPSAK